jgi:glycosyltransferase involved in cell wall biosynthesis
MDVSIIIPTYNRLWSLPKTIESCRNTNCQTEIIVIDDGSTDRTLNWLEQQEGLVILQQNHLGKCWTVNKGFSVARGKYTRFLDSDDLLAKGAIDEQFQLAEKYDSDIVVSGYNDIDENDSIIKTQLWVDCDDFVAQQLGECDGSHYSAFLFKKSFITEIPHRPEYAFRDDRMFILESAIKNPKISIHEGAALLHRVNHSDRLQLSTGLKQTVQNYQHLNVYNYILNQLKQQNELSLRRITASENVLWPLCHWIAKDNIEEAAILLQWIYELDPDFKIPESGILGWLYNKLGFKVTEQLLKIRRAIIR